jgi:hypothetical protein
MLKPRCVCNDLAFDEGAHGRDYVAVIVVGATTFTLGF